METELDISLEASSVAGLRKLSSQDVHRSRVRLPARWSDDIKRIGGIWI